MSLPFPLAEPDAAAIEAVATESLSRDFAIDWSGASYQEKKTEDTTAIALGLAVVMVFLILAALYERWSLPLATIVTSKKRLAELKNRIDSGYWKQYASRGSVASLEVLDLNGDRLGDIGIGDLAGPQQQVELFDLLVCGEQVTFDMLTYITQHISIGIHVAHLEALCQPA